MLPGPPARGVHTKPCGNGVGALGAFSDPGGQRASSACRLPLGLTHVLGRDLVGQMQDLDGGA